MKHFLLIITLFAAANAVISQTSIPLWRTLPEVPPLPPADDSGWARVNDIKMYYAIYNKEGKEPMILLHGGFGSSADWGFEVPLLRKTHKVIVADSRGHGRSTLSAQPLSYELMTSDVVQLMDDLKLQKASIIGWSDGGIIGLLLAIHHPERVNKLFTFGANYNLSGYKTEPEPVDSNVASHFMARAKANYSRLSPTPDSFSVLRKALGKMYSAEPNLSPAELKKIHTPTVIACGEYDQFIKQEHFRELAQLIPGAKLVIIPSVGHGGAWQDPVRFHQAVASLLNGD